MPDAGKPEATTPTPAAVTLCFATKTLFLEKEGGVETVETVEFVKAEQLLAYILPQDNKDTSAAPDKNRPPVKRIVLLPGPGAHLSAQGDSLLAAVIGYPQVIKGQNKNDETLTVSITPLVTISPDQMEAHLTLYPPLPGTASLTVEELALLLKQAGIRYGLNNEILHNCLELSEKEHKITTGTLIAMGSQPIPGQDAFLRFEMEIGSIPGKIMGDGRMDFRERRMFIGVRKGQLIATKVPATSGTSGVNVLGHPLAQKPGQDITVSVVDNACYDPANGSVHATKPGVLSVVKNTIKVSSKLTIPGDINFKTGNIEASDAVDIGGSVQPGFKVIAHGDLRISGGVRSATVSSQGNVLIKEGVSGKQTVLRVAGDLDLPFVEQANITVGGTVILRKQAYYCQILAGGDICCQEDSIVLGGKTIAGGKLRLGQVGSENAPPTLIAAGTDYRQYLRYDTLQNEIFEKEDELEHSLNIHGHNSQLPFHLVMTQELEEMHRELRALNLAAGEKADSEEEESKRLRSHSIMVQRTIFAGTLLRIGNVTMELTTTVSARKFSLSEDLERIIATPI
jgi:uncharacterized protein (DUF342 family)